MNAELTRMGELCTVAISKATKSMEEGDLSLARDVINADGEIDQLERDIERICFRLLLQQQPVARDLRQISAALKMITDMERIGDQASDIAEIILSAQHSEGIQFALLREMSEEAVKMVNDSVASFVRQDLELARQVELSDDDVDEKFNMVRDDMVVFIQENPKEAATDAIDILMIAKYMERIADHATNISEWVEFSITGVHEGGIDTKKKVD